MEVRITCRIKSLSVSDLGLSLKKGDVVYLPEETAFSSSELNLAQKSGAVEIIPIRRAQSTRTPIEKPSRFSTARHPVKVPLAEPRKQEPPKIPLEKIEPSRVSLEQTPKKKGRPPKSEVENNE